MDVVHHSPGDEVVRVGAAGLRKLVEAGATCTVELVLEDAEGIAKIAKILQDARCAIRGLRLKVEEGVAAAESGQIKASVLALCRTVPGCVDELSLRGFGPIEFEAAHGLPPSIKKLDIEGLWIPPQHAEFLASRTGLKHLEAGIEEGIDMTFWADAVVEAAHADVLETLILRKRGENEIDPKGFALGAVETLLGENARLVHLTLPDDCYKCLSHRFALNSLSAHPTLMTVTLGGGRELPDEAAAILQFKRMAATAAIQGLGNPREFDSLTGALCARWSAIAETDVLSPREIKGAQLASEFSKHMKLCHDAFNAKTGADRMQVAVTIRGEIDDCPGVSDQIKDKLRSLVNIEIESCKFALLVHGHTNPYLRKMASPEQAAWRLVMDGKAQSKGIYHFEKQRGFMAGALRGLNFMLENLDAPLTVEHFIELHDTAVEGAHESDANTPDKLVKKGLRPSNWNGRFGLDFSKGGSATQEGLAEFRMSASKNALSGSKNQINLNGKLTECAWVNFVYIRGEPRVYVTAPADPLLVKAKIAEIIDLCHSELARARSIPDPDDRERAVLSCIATRCQDLAQHHFFSDGNLRTVTLVMNKLLMQNGYSPTIMWEPNEYAMCSVAQIVNTIRRGQATFADLLTST